MTTEIIATQGFGAAKRLDDGRYRIIVSGEAELLAEALELLAEDEALWSNLASLLLLETGVDADDFPMSVDCAFETLKNEFNQRASDRDKLTQRIAELEAENDILRRANSKTEAQDDPEEEEKLYKFLYEDGG